MSRIITGTELRNDLLNLELTRKPIVNELLFEKDVFLLSSDSGAGKSVFSTLLAACLSFKHPFLGLEIPEAKKVCYIQLEGDYEESIERMRFMEKEGGVIIEENNLLWIEEKTLNVLDKASVAGFFKRINDTGFKVINVCIIDPIYKLCTKDIRDGEAALAIIRFSDTLYNKYNCTNVLIHHNTKTSYSSQGEKIDKEDSYYGHSFIKNHVRTSYAFKITGFNTRDLILKKGRGSDTRRKIHLEFNPETWTLNEASNLPAHKRGSHVERFFSFLESSLKAKRQLDASTILEECDITYNQLRTLKLKPETTALFSIQKTHDKNKEIWIPKII